MTPTPTPPASPDRIAEAISEIKKAQDCLARVKLRESIAELEHDQWIEWSKTIAKQEPAAISGDRLARWQRCWVPYCELSEEMKDHDRKWADKVIAILSPPQPEPAAPPSPSPEPHTKAQCPGQVDCDIHDKPEPAAPPSPSPEPAAEANCEVIGKAHGGASVSWVVEEIDRLTRLRQAISTIATAVGGYVDPACSIDFLCEVPKEVESVMGKLRAENTTLRQKLAAAEADRNAVAVESKWPGLFQWLANGERGISSETIVTVITGIPVGQRMSPPHDGDDLRRCRLLLEAVPSLIPHLDKLDDNDPAWRIWTEKLREMDSMREVPTSAFFAAMPTDFMPLGCKPAAEEPAAAAPDVDDGDAVLREALALLDGSARVIDMFCADRAECDAKRKGNGGRK